MPYKDYKDQQRWLKEAIAGGYGKRLYARRKLHREHAIHFQGTLEEVLSVCRDHTMYEQDKVTQIEHTVREVLNAAVAAEETLKGWKRNSKA